MKSLKLLFVLVLLTFTPIVSILTALTQAQDAGTILSIDPRNIIDATIAPGNTITINVTVINVTNLFGCQVKLGFNPNILECKSVSLPPDHIFAGKVYSSPPPVIDNTGGTVLAMTILMGAQPGINVTKGTFCQMIFQVKTRGISNITFLEIDKKTYLIDPNGQKIHFTPYDGYFNNRLPISPATLVTSPQKIVDPSLTPCNDFTLNVTILQATDLYRWQLSIYYKKDIINCTNVQEGPFLKSGGSTTFYADIQNDFNATHGKVSANSTLLDVTGVNGNGTLLTLTFHVLNLGNTTISLSEISLIDSTSEPIPYTKQDGYFNNQLLAKLHVSPEQVVGPQWLPTTSFTINITIEDVEDLYGYEFKLNYDGAILTCYGIIVHPLGENYFITSFYANDSMGQVWVKFELYSPATPVTAHTNITLVTLLFKVDKIGESVLHLSDTQIANAEGIPITHETTDGYFATLIVDISITEATAFPTKVYEGWNVYINVTVLNKGNLTETFNVNAYYDNNSIGTITVENLAPGEERTITFTWNTTSVIPYYAYNYTINVEVPPLVYEINVADNNFTDGLVAVKLMGDINNDGVVEMLDFNLMIDAFGSYPEHPRWNPECDLNQDQMVELLDFLILSSNFGRSCASHP